MLTSLCHSVCMCVLKKTPDLHVRCCHGNAVEQFSQFLFQTTLVPTDLSVCGMVLLLLHTTSMCRASAHMTEKYKNLNKQEQGVWERFTDGSDVEGVSNVWRGFMHRATQTNLDSSRTQLCFKEAFNIFNMCCVYSVILN